jgi:hypothetical protein
MSSVKVGDSVLTLDVATGRAYYDEVIAFLHRSENNTDDQVYLRLTLECGRSISLTPQHLVYVMAAVEDELPGELTFGEPRFASSVRPGDYLFHLNGRSGSFVKKKVAAVTVERGNAGLFAPLTMSGTMLVDDVLVSCYAHFEMYNVAHWAMAPLRAVYTLTKLIGWKLESMWSTTDDCHGVHPYAGFLNRLVIPHISEAHKYTVG